MNILFIHHSCPAQYQYILPALCQDPNNKIVFLCHKNVFHLSYANLEIITYSENGREAVSEIDEMTHLKRTCLSAKNFAQELDKLKNKFTPEIILCHPGFGQAFYLRNYFKEAKLLSYMENYSGVFGQTIFFDPLEQLNHRALQKIEMRKLTYLQAALDSDYLIAPTYFQSAFIPEEFQHKLITMHDGIDTDNIKPQNPKSKALLDKLGLSENTPIITYVARNFEPLRGLVTFMEAIPLIQLYCKDAHILMIGSKEKGYQDLPKGIESWYDLLQENIEYDTSKVHLLGALGHKEYLNFLNLSDIHIYLTKPFVLSWSILESMAAGCCLISSATKPVMEVIKDNHNGILIDFFSSKELAQKVDFLLNHKSEREGLAKNARQTILEKYSLQKLLPMHIELIYKIAKGQDITDLRERIKNYNPPLPEINNITHYNDVTLL